MSPSRDRITVGEAGPRSENAFREP